MHPAPLLKNIPYSQYLRIKQNCSRNCDFQKAADDLYCRLKSRGYSHSCLKGAYNRVIKKDQNSLIFSHKETKKSDSMRIITQYSAQHHQIRQIVDTFWPLLSADPIINKYVGERLKITYRWAPSLKDRLVHSHFEVSDPVFFFF